MAELSGQCYLGLQDYKKAYDILLPKILDNGFADNTDLVNLAYTALRKNYSNGQLKDFFELAFKDIRKEKRKNGKYESEITYINFLDRKVEIQNIEYLLASQQDHEGEIARIYNRSAFYKLLTVQ